MGRIRQVDFENPKASAQNGYELARKVATRLKASFLIHGADHELATDVKKLVNEYFVNESEIEARS